MTKKFSARAKRHAESSARDKKRQIAKSKEPTPVKVSWLPGKNPKEGKRG